MVDNKDFNEELKENIQEELDNETKAENHLITEYIENSPLKFKRVIQKT